MDMIIRPFQATDIARLVEILQLNGQYEFPEVEGPEAMRRFADCSAAVFLVAVSGEPQGLIRAVYDGSRAMIHLLSVHPEAQGSGVGRALVDAAEAELRRRGAPSLSVTATDASAAFWEKQGFERIPVYLMLKTFDSRSTPGKDGPA